MHIRQSLANGMPVVDDSTQQTVGILSEPVIDPDNGRIVGFFVFPASVGRTELFLRTQDIASWGTRVHILSDDRLGPPEDFIRLEVRLSDSRPFLGQTIRIRGSGRSLGILDDVQFSTRHFVVEWLFPRKWFFVRQPIPISDVVEVTEEAVWVKDPIKVVREKRSDIQTTKTDPVLDILPQTSRSADVQ